jgi:hypothetical protein
MVVVTLEGCSSQKRKALILTEKHFPKAASEFHMACSEIQRRKCTNAKWDIELLGLYMSSPVLRGGHKTLY